MYTPFLLAFFTVILFPNLIYGQTQALINARVIDGKGSAVVDNATIVIEGGIITDVGEGLPVPPGAEVMNMKGKTVIPGLIDAHAHLWSKGIPQYQIYSQLFLASGVTTVFSCGDLYPDSLYAFRKSVENGEKVGPRIYSVGPYFQKSIPMGQAGKVDTPEQAVEVYHRYRHLSDGIKIYDLVDKEQFDILVSLAIEDGKLVVAHTGFGVSTIYAIENGLDYLSHGYWCIGDLYPETDDSPYCKIASVDVEGPDIAHIIGLLAEYQVAVSPTFYSLMTTSDDFVPLVNNWQIYLNDHSRRNYKPFKTANQDCQKVMMEKQMVFIKKLFDAGGLIVQGTDCVFPEILAGFGMVKELEYTVKSGIPNLEAIKTATLNPAKLLGLDHILGSIEPGKLADLVVIAGEPDRDIGQIANVIAVCKGGTWFDPFPLLQQSVGQINLFKD
jgi:imidazolonepropionase-like amidohydrolase